MNSPTPSGQDIRSVVQVAMNLVRAVKSDVAVCTAIDGDDVRRIARHSRLLYAANSNDSAAVEGALYSAVLEIRNARFSKDDEPSLSARENDSVLELIRVAYNRAQRSVRQSKRMAAEAKRGESKLGESGVRGIEGLSKNFFDFHAQIRELLDGIYGDLDTRERTVVDQLAQGMTAAEVAALVGVHRTTIARIVTGIANRMRRFLDDEPDSEIANPGEVP